MPKPMKRPNNSGSVYKLPGRRRKPWVASTSLGYDENGRRIRCTSIHYTKAEALQALALYDINPVERPNIRLRELYEEWSEEHFKRVKKKSIEGYRYGYSKLKPYYNSKFAELRTAHYQKIIDSLDLSYSALHKMKNLLLQLYHYAMQNDISAKNYAEFIKLPRQTNPEKDCFTSFHIKKLRDNDHLHVVKIILIMIYTGFRPSALLEMTRFNYDAKNKVLVGGIKTDAGRGRTVPVHPAIQPYVDYFVGLNGNRLICNINGGGYNDLDNFRDRQYYPQLESLGLPKLPPMRCRHTFSSLLVQSKADTVAHQKLMGHTKYAMSAEAYSHFEIENLRKEIEKIPGGG